MESNFKSIATNLGKFSVLIGASTAGYAFGSPIIGNVIGGLLTNLASSQLDKLELEKVRKILSRVKPSELNHDLEKTIAEALIWTIKNIAYLYEPYCTEENQKKALEKITETLITQINEADKSYWLNSNKVIRQLDELESPDTLMSSFIKDLGKFPSINKNISFPKFFEEHFFKNFQLCFGELLKNPKNQAALITYNRNVSKQILQNLQSYEQDLAEIKKNNFELKIALEKLAQSPIQKIEQEIILPKLKIELDQFLEPLHEKVKLLVDSNGKILALVQTIKKEGEIQTQQIHELSKKVEKNTRIYAIILPVLAISVAYLAYRYWQNQQPFIFTVKVENTSINKELPFENPEISFTYHDKTETMKATDEAIFKNLPSSLRGDSARIKVVCHGFQTLDSSILLHDNHILLAISRDDTYKFIIGQVKDAINGEAINDAEVLVQDLQTKTNKSGNFKLPIPATKQKAEQRLRVKKDGYKEWNRNEPVIKNTESIIHLEKF